MNIVGLGQAGCAIVDSFSKHPQYNTYRLDSGLKRSATTCPIPKNDSHEAYDKGSPRLKTFISEMEDSKEVLFIMAGSGIITGVSLRVLQELNERFAIHVLYIKPDSSLLNGLGYLQDRLCYRVLQEYARSGVLESICLVSNPHMEEVIGEVPVIGYYDQLNELLVSVFHMINVFKHTAPIIETSGALAEHIRIYTVGTMDVDSGEQKLFFPLNKISDKCYYYGIKKEDLETDGKLFRKIKDQVRGFSAEQTGVSYSIHSTAYGENFVYFTAHSPTIQTFPEKPLDI